MTRPAFLALPRAGISVFIMALLTSQLTLQNNAYSLGALHSTVCKNKTLGDICSDSDGWRWVFDSNSQTYRRIFKGTSNSVAGTSYTYFYAPACPGNFLAGDELCGRALNTCATTDPGAIYYNVWKQETQPALGEPLPQPAICLGGKGDNITVAQVGKDVDDEVRDHLPKFSPQAQPNPDAIVNLPIIVSAPIEPAPNFNVDEPFPGQVVVTSTYNWKFDDGTTLTGIGRLYDGTDPRTAPAGYYLDHTYTRADPNGSVTLTVTWHAMFTLNGGTPVALPDITTTPQTIPFQVHEARSVLVSH